MAGRLLRPTRDAGLLVIVGILGAIILVPTRGDDMSSRILRAVNQGDMGVVGSIVPERRAEVGSVLSALSDLTDEWLVARRRASIGTQAIELRGGEKKSVLILVVNAGDYFDMVFVPLRDLDWYVNEFPQLSIVFQSAVDCTYTPL